MIFVLEIIVLFDIFNRVKCYSIPSAKIGAKIAPFFIFCTKISIYDYYKEKPIFKIVNSFKIDYKK
jgi:hypothetical protein